MIRPDHYTVIVVAGTEFLSRITLTLLSPPATRFTVLVLFLFVLLEEQCFRVTLLQIKLIKKRGTHKAAHKSPRITNNILPRCSPFETLPFSRGLKHSLLNQFLRQWWAVLARSARKVARTRSNYYHRRRHGVNDARRPMLLIIIYPEMCVPSLKPPQPLSST